MTELNKSHIYNGNPPPTVLQQKLIPVLQKLKSCYSIWYRYFQIIPKPHRYTLGQKIDNLFVEIIEATAVASFLSKEEKQPWIRLAIRKLETLKVLMAVLWENDSLEDKKYIAISVPLDEIGRNLGGWSGQISKQNSPDKKSGEK